MAQIRLFYDREDGPHDVVLCTDDIMPQQIVVLFQNVTEEAAGLLSAEFDMVDLTDMEQVMAIRADLVARAPRAYSWHYRQYLRQQSDRQVARRCNGQFKVMGVRS